MHQANLYRVFRRAKISEMLEMLVFGKSWQIGFLDVVLLEYPDKSHNLTFDQFNFYDVITLELFLH